MELIDGVPLGEHFHSLKKKQQQFTEERIWNIFIQVSKRHTFFFFFSPGLFYLSLLDPVMFVRLRISKIILISYTNT